MDAQTLENETPCRGNGHGLIAYDKNEKRFCEVYRRKFPSCYRCYTYSCVVGGCRTFVSRRFGDSHGFGRIVSSLFDKEIG